MASTVSSYLSKSKKDFKPKAPFRRPVPAPASSQASLRGSVDRQLHSQAAQPSPRPDGASSEDPATQEQPPIASSTAQRRRPNVTAIHDVLEDGAIPALTAHQSSSSQGIPAIEHTPNSQASSIHARGEGGSSNQETRAPVPSRVSESFSSAIWDANHSSTAHANHPLSQSENGNQVESERPSKRRKVITAQLVGEKHHQARSTRAQAGAGAEQTTTRAAPDHDQASPERQNHPSRLQQKRSQARTTQQTRADSIPDALEASTAAKDGQRKKASRNTRTTVRRGKARPTTPEESQRSLEPDSVRMSDLCVDNGKGRKSGRETRLEDRDAEAKQAKARSQNDEASQDGHALRDAAAPSTLANVDEPRGAPRLVPTLQLVNGQIVLDEASRIIDRHADAEATRQPQEEQLEDDLSRKINAGTFMKRTSSTRWTEECNQMFFDGLRMFGTDFGMISKLFPGRTRRHIKLKYDREERLDSARIKEALDETIPVDMESFSRISQTEYKDPRELENAMAEDRARLEEEQAREKEAMEELTRQRAAEAAAESAAVGGESSAKENEAGVVEAAEGDPKPTRRGRKPGPRAGKRVLKAGTASGGRLNPSGGIVLGAI